ncbi:unnamed protein product [Ixodes pacificus]
MSTWPVKAFSVTRSIRFSSLTSWSAALSRLESTARADSRACWLPPRLGAPLTATVTRSTVNTVLMALTAPSVVDADSDRHRSLNRFRDSFQAPTTFFDAHTPRRHVSANHDNGGRRANLLVFRLRPTTRSDEQRR